MKHDRIFCPLKSKWFDLVKAGRKTWEFRNSKSPVARQISKMTGYDLDKREFTELPAKGSFLIEFRKGYSGESLRGKILKLELYDTPDTVEDEVLRKACLTRADLHEIQSRGHLVAIRFELQEADAG